MSDIDPTVSGASEEEYFLRHNQKLIEARRKSLDKNREEEEKLHRKMAHWMKCPKCGQDMEEIDLHGVKVDRCTAPECRGLYFDKGEVDLLLELQAGSGFLKRIKELIG